MIAFDAAQWVVVVGLLVVTNLGSWLMSMHFTMKREIRRQLAEKKKKDETELSKKQKRKSDYEKNTLGQIKNLVEIQIRNVTTSLRIAEGADSGSQLLVTARGRVCSVYCNGYVKSVWVVGGSQSDFTPRFPTTDLSAVVDEVVFILTQ